ncbi:NTF2-like protein [Amniculicola lignicola CBS 123094]|uniref:NTF2-like protein n=1 Tax=Amniculicola lignicola CBS 123094 TaxID=1392246 RepID=A0A6A5WDS2_9PLEO|nr:NTF2-like protein [Amniculicola lignicola CBS 123094]
MSSSLLIIQNLYNAYKANDLTAFYTDLSPTLTWTESAGFPTAGTYHTKEEIVANVFSVLARDWDDWFFTLEELIDGGKDVVAVGTYRGRNKGTGRAFESRAAHVWRVVGGKIEGFEQFADTAVMQNAALDG